MLLPYRLLAGMVRHQDDLPASIPLIFDLAQGAGVPIPPDQHPPMLVMPVFGELPGILIGHAPDTRLNIGYQVISNRELYLSIAAAGDNRQVSLHFDIVAFLRMMAKIAHGFAVAEIGLEEFDPALHDLIFGRNLALGSFLVGRSDISAPVPAEGLGHQMGWRPERWGQQWLVGVRIRLFAAHSTHPFTVIAGTLSPSAVARWGLT
jgi:hypothetical protein